ncbi:Eisosome component PIL1-domain-containing protein [Spinellus fusiger]|nr:Eisosome component PIL1-domain-containing protein [Spinellus fusiger]
MLKDLQYSLGKLTSDVRTSIARSNLLMNQDTKALSMWIYKERNDLAGLRTLAYQRAETNKTLLAWAKEEREEEGEDGVDLEDIIKKLVQLLEKQVELEQEYAAKYRQYRHAIKSIREKEDQLSEMREKKRTLQARISNLTLSNPKSPKLKEFQRELTLLQRDTHTIEMEMGDFKRFALREAFYLRFNAMNEFSEKTAILSGFGKYLVDLIDIEPTPQGQPHRTTYTKGTEATTIIEDAMAALDSWSPAEGEERPTYLGMDIMDDASSVYTLDPSDHTRLKAKHTAPFSLSPSSSTHSPSYSHSYSHTGTSSASLLSRTNSQTGPETDSLDPTMYNAPPPAYSNHSTSSTTFHPPNLSDEPAIIEEKQLVEEEGYKYPAFKMTHSPLPLPGRQPLYPPSLTGYPPTLAGPTTTYQQLFRQVSRRQQEMVQRPYQEFQQQFMERQAAGVPFYQRRDAGGFRVPPPREDISAEEEKQQLAYRYAEEERGQSGFSFVEEEQQQSHSVSTVVTSVEQEQEHGPSVDDINVNANHHDASDNDECTNADANVNDDECTIENANTNENGYSEKAKHNTSITQEILDEEKPSSQEIHHEKDTDKEISLHNPPLEETTLEEFLHKD